MTGGAPWAEEREAARKIDDGAERQKEESKERRRRWEI